MLLPLPIGGWALRQAGDAVYYCGGGATPEGDSPLPDLRHMGRDETDRLFHHTTDGYEYPHAFGGDDDRIMIRSDSAVDMPNYHLVMRGVLMEATPDEAERAPAACPSASSSTCHRATRSARGGPLWPMPTRRSARATARVRSTIPSALCRRADHGTAGIDGVGTGVRWSNEDPERRCALARARDGFASRRNPVSLTADTLDAFVGRYDVRQVRREGDHLVHQRSESPPMTMIPMDADSFRLAEIDYFRMRFERDDRGRVIRLVGLYDDGRTDTSERSR